MSLGKRLAAARKAFRHATLTETASNLIPPRGSVTALTVTPESALRLSAVWACLRLRADLISTLPVDVYKTAMIEGNEVQVELPKPPVLRDPDGEGIGLAEWLYSSQIDLDRYGNTFGIILDRNALGLPARIMLVPAGSVGVRVRDGRLVEYRIEGKPYSPENVWHERQFTAAGLHVGLSPVAYAAWSMSGALSAQQFAAEWFGNDGVPSGHLRNTEQEIVGKEESAMIKDRFRAAVSGHDVLVTGRDWEYKMIGVPANQTAFIEQMAWGVADTARFLGVPGDMIDAEKTSGSITYANVTQRNLQLLIMHLGPALVRREYALSRLVLGSRYVKFNRDALLAMDPAGRAAHFKALIDARTLAPSEARALDNRAPFTPEQLAEFDRFWPAKTAPAMASGGTQT